MLDYINRKLGDDMYTVKLNDGETFSITEEIYVESDWENVMNDNKVVFVKFGKRSTNKHKISEIIPSDVV